MSNHAVVQIGGRRRRVRNSARVFVDNHYLGEINSPHDLTPSMLAHGVTQEEVAKILAGVRHRIHFRCAGEVEIQTGRSLITPPRRRVPAAEGEPLLFKRA